MHGVPVRCIGLYQPFASLMRHGKIETRWVQKGRKPPFPEGLYLIYSTKRRYELGEIMEISGRKCFDWMEEVLRGDQTVGQLGYTICLGYLYIKHPMTKDIELECFVEHKESETHDLWAMRFKEVVMLEPTVWNHGKQGVGFVPESEYDNIIVNKQ